MSERAEHVKQTVLALATPVLAAIVAGLLALVWKSQTVSIDRQQKIMVQIAVVQQQILTSSDAAERERVETRDWRQEIDQWRQETEHRVTVLEARK